MLKSSFKKLRQWVSNLNINRKAEGKKLTTYQCPHCKTTLNTIQPCINQVTTTGFREARKACYQCGKTAIVKTWYDGETEVITFSQ